ncbi:Minor allergen Alt a 7 [Lachnellula hyalina]|uniref:Minor allergen Alt a 7 n=1 Tax=Lachnellula hyalina TaxID=1316788 RepID=A0A8H8R8R7_9HELO|nr:Minor allergen Alt a 7 [Lachnellula hyalina]TVY30430.1 Minor allergen Alt a 7 [Lachnellula hyalina]
MAPKVAIVFYSMYGHIQKLAEAEKEGLKKAGIEADLFQVPETLPEEVLAKMHAPPKSDIPLIDAKTLEQYDAFLIGIPTRYGNFPAQWKAFWDTTGAQWAAGGYWGKYAGIFVSTGTPGGGQESTVVSALSTLTHHGIIYVPLGYKTAFGQLANLSEVRGGSPWGAGTFSGADGSRQPSPLELEVATIHGESFGNAVSKMDPKPPMEGELQRRERKNKTMEQRIPQLKNLKQTKRQRRSRDHVDCLPSAQYYKHML